jgi:hypothetical protein
MQSEKYLGIPAARPTVVFLGIPIKALFIQMEAHMVRLVMAIGVSGTACTSVRQDQRLLPPRFALLIGPWSTSFAPGKQSGETRLNQGRRFVAMIPWFLTASTETPARFLVALLRISSYPTPQKKKGITWVSHTDLSGVVLGWPTGVIHRQDANTVDVLQRKMRLDSLKHGKNDL